MTETFKHTAQLSNSLRADSGCRHKFLGTNHCIKCGWKPSAEQRCAALQSRLAVCEQERDKLIVAVGGLRARLDLTSPPSADPTTGSR